MTLNQADCGFRAIGGQDSRARLLKYLLQIKSDERLILDNEDCDPVETSLHPNRLGHGRRNVFPDARHVSLASVVPTVERILRAPACLSHMRHWAQRTWSETVHNRRLRAK